MDVSWRLHDLYTLYYLLNTMASKEFFCRQETALAKSGRVNATSLSRVAVPMTMALDDSAEANAGDGVRYNIETGFTGRKRARLLSSFLTDVNTSSLVPVPTQCRRLHCFTGFIRT